MLALTAVIDPELFIPITDMGLIYGAHLEQKESKNTALITMTLTTIGCPLFDVIKKDIEEVLYGIDGVEDVHIELTFDPPWHTGMMSEETRLDLGVF